MYHRGCLPCRTSSLQGSDTTLSAPNYLLSEQVWKLINTGKNTQAGILESSSYIDVSLLAGGIQRWHLAKYGRFVDRGSWLGVLSSKGIIHGINTFRLDYLTTVSTDNIASIVGIPRALQQWLSRVMWITDDTRGKTDGLVD